MLYSAQLALMVLTSSVMLSASQPHKSTIEGTGLTHRDCGHRSHNLASHYTSPGKPGTAVAELAQTHFSSDSVAPLDLSLQLASPLKEGELIINIHSDPQLAIALGSTQYRLPLDEDIPSLPLKLNAEKAGIYHLHVTVQHQVEGQTLQARAMAAEIRFGAELPEKQFAKSYGANEYPDAVVLPAMETVR